jgi:hypothetical protein
MASRAPNAIRPLTFLFSWPRVRASGDRGRPRLDAMPPHRRGRKREGGREGDEVRGYSARKEINFNAYRLRRPTND